MKPLIQKPIILLILIIFGSLTSNCQSLSTLIRGHDNNDIYVFTSTETPPGGQKLFYLTLDGKKISLQNKDLLYSQCLTAEIGPGFLIGISNSYFGESIDYGKVFSVLPPFVNTYTSAQRLYGGEIPGEFIILGSDPSIWPSPMGVIYKTSDYFAHYTLIADTSNGIINGETGIVSGELFQMPVINKHAFLAHSLDFGATFDTIPVDTTILNENTGLLFKALSRGSVQGELFLVTKHIVSESEIHYFIYHTTDYGATWLLKSSPVFDSDRQQFTAGRGACKFYIGSLQAMANTTYYKLQIQYSSDCGETFTTYEHLLTPQVGLKEPTDIGNGLLEIAPNPASQQITLCCPIARPSDIEVAVYNSAGICVLLTAPAWEAGAMAKTINIKNLKQGVYSVQLRAQGSAIASGKFIISR